MKITDYPKTKSLDKDQVLLVDGPTGTKTITIEDYVYALALTTHSSVRRNTYRGKNLGSVYTDAQKLAIDSGTFDDLWLGDYWEIDGVRWLIADFDYWLGTGSPKFTKHHLVIIPQSNLYLAIMNTSGNATGGYVGSLMYTQNLDQAKQMVRAAFPGGLLTHSERLTNAVDTATGVTTGAAWVDTTVDLPSEVMMYGSRIMGSGPSGVGSWALQTNSKHQLALFRYDPYLIESDGMWLRDIILAKNWVFIANSGQCEAGTASGAVGVRPVFALGSTL